MRSAACADVERADTENIAEMRDHYRELVQGGFDYVAEDHGLFSPKAMNARIPFAALRSASNRSLDEMIAGVASSRDLQAR